jgi:2-phosphosulfolactate phosphatase
MANDVSITLMPDPSTTAGTPSLRIQTVILPRELHPDQIADHTVVVFDVLRATTSITAALAAGIKEIRVFDTIEAAQSAANAFGQPRLLCGERHTLPPPGFDLGNSPGQFDPKKHAGMTMFLSTTNGTRAIVAAKSAPLLLTGALVNADAAAKKAYAAGRDVTLLCSGSDGNPSMEDLLGAGAVIDSLSKLGPIEFDGDLSRIAIKLFHACRDSLPTVLADTFGGHNIRRVHLDADITFAARLNVLDVVGQVKDNPLRITP